MYCKNCGTDVTEGTKFCPNCGKPVDQPQQAGAVQPQMPVQPQQAYIPEPPVNQNAQQAPQPMAYSYAASESAQIAAENGGKGANVGALLCGIIGLILSFIAGPTFGVIGSGIALVLCILGIIFGISAKKGSAGARGTGGMVCGIIGAIFSALFCAGCALCGSAINETFGDGGMSFGMYGCVGGTLIETKGAVSTYQSKADISADTQLCDTVRTAITTAMMDPDVLNNPSAEYPKQDRWISIDKVMDCDVFGDAVKDIIGTKNPAKKLNNGDDLEVYITGNIVVVRVVGYEDIYAGPIEKIDD